MGNVPPGERDAEKVLHPGRGGRNGVAYENDRNRKNDRSADERSDVSQTSLEKNGSGVGSRDLAGVGSLALQHLFWKKERGIHNRCHMCIKLS